MVILAPSLTALSGTEQQNEEGESFGLAIIVFFLSFLVLALLA